MKIEKNISWPQTDSMPHPINYYLLVPDTNYMVLTSHRCHALDLCPSDFFHKSSLSFGTLRWAINSPGRNASSFQTWQCPNEKQQTSVFFAHNSGRFFWKIIGAQAFLRWGCISLQEPIIQQKTTIVCEISEKKLRGPRYLGVSIFTQS